MFYLILEIAIIGLLAWAATRWIPMPAGVKTVIYVVAVVASVLLALQAFGVMGMLHSPPVPQVHG